MSETAETALPRIDMADEGTINILVGAAAFARDLIRLAWSTDIIDSAKIDEIALSFGLVVQREPTDDERATGDFAEGDVAEEFSRCFGTVVDQIDAAESAVVAEMGMV